MNHLLISDIARQELAERLLVARRERLARGASLRARRPEGRISRTVRGIRQSLAEWRVRTQLGAMNAPLCVDECAESSAL
jgi:hypothetical protein